MRAVRKDYFLDHDHSSYVDQWDWEKRITADMRNLDYLKDMVRKIWKVITGAEDMRPGHVPEAEGPDVSRDLPEELKFLHAEEILEMYPDLPRKQRETEIISEQYPADLHHRHRLGAGRRLPARDARRRLRRLGHADDTEETGKHTHGLNGDILVWNPVTKRRHELTSMGIRVTKETLKQQLEISKQLDFLKLPYHQAILNDKIPLSIGGGIGQSRTLMWMLKKAHLGEVSVTVVAEAAEGHLREEEHPRARVAATRTEGGLSRLRSRGTV